MNKGGIINILRGKIAKWVQKEIIYIMSGEGGRRFLQGSKNIKNQKEAEKALNIINYDYDRPLDEIISDLQNFYEILCKWQKVQNLVSRETLQQYWHRHVADSLQILPYIDKNSKNIADLGSGGGFPAVVLAIILAKKPIKFTLIEANSRKTAFLRTVKRKLQLNMQIINSRIENYEFSEENRPDIITARALAPLNELLNLIFPKLQDKTKLILLKGKEYSGELAKANSEWQYNVIINNSATDQCAVILEISNIARKV